MIYSSHCVWSMMRSVLCDVIGAEDHQLLVDHDDDDDQDHHYDHEVML